MCWSCHISPRIRRSCCSQRSTDECRRSHVHRFWSCTKVYEGELMALTLTRSCFVCDFMQDVLAPSDSKFNILMGKCFVTFSKPNPPASHYEAVIIFYVKNIHSITRSLCERLPLLSAPKEKILRTHTPRVCFRLQMKLKVFLLLFPVTFHRKSRCTKMS